MLGAEWLTGPRQRDQVVRSIQIRQWQVGRKPLLGDDQAVLRVRLQLRALEQELHGNSFERVVESAPGRDAMNVAVHRFAGELQEFAVRQSKRILNETRNYERPCGCVDHWDVAVMQHRPFGGFDLAGRDPRPGGLGHSRAHPSGCETITPNAVSNPFITALTLSSHNCSVLPAPRSLRTDVISTP